MTTIDRTLDLDLAPARRTIAMRLLEAAGGLTGFFRVFRNRREIGSLRELSDAHLADIGLTRADVDASLFENRFGDPSDYLTSVAFGRPKGRRRAR